MAALLVVLLASPLVGSMVGIVLVAAFAPVLARFALEFGAAEYFSLMVFALFAAAAVGGSDMLKSLSMVVITSMIGGGGLGDVVLRGIQQLNVGLGFEGGLAVVILAIILDRLSQSLVKAPQRP